MVNIGVNGKMNVLIVEDERIQRDNLAKIIETNFVDIRVYKAKNYKEAMDFINNKEINLFFIDINLDKISGIKLAEKIRTIDKHKLTGIIFVTAEFLHIAEAVKKAHCYDYIVKPYKDEQIKCIINVFLSNLELKYDIDSKYTILDIDSYTTIKISHKEIIFIKSINKYCEIYTLNGVYKTKRLSLNKFVKDLDDENIIQTYKSFAVNTKYINRIEKAYDKLWIIKLRYIDEEVLLSKTYRDKVMEKIK